MKSDGENVRCKMDDGETGPWDSGYPRKKQKLIDRMVALSGLTKQEYILRKLMDWEVTVQGNSKSL